MREAGQNGVTNAWDVSGALGGSPKGLGGHSRSHGRTGDQAQGRGGKWGKTRRAAAARLGKMMEALENRTLLSITAFEPVNITEEADIARFSRDQSSAQVAVNKADPTQLVSVAVRNREDALNIDFSTEQLTRISLAFSTDNGVSWASINVADNDTDPTNGTTSPKLAIAESPSIAWDRNGNFYLSYLQRNTAGTAGNLRVLRYSLDVTDPANPVANLDRTTVLYRWAGGDDAITSPSMVVDDTLAAFTDPDTGGTVANPNSGNVYVSYVTVDTAPTGASNFNPNRVMLVVSSDLGVSFSAPQVINDGGNSGNERNARPRLAISQGRSSDRIDVNVDTINDTALVPGQVTIIWDDFNTNAGNPLPTSIIKSDKVRTTNRSVGGVNQTPVAIPDFNQLNPVFAESVVALTAPVGFLSTDIEVKVALIHPDTSNLRVRLRSPGGSFINLVVEGEIDGQALGVANVNTSNQTIVPTVFSADAARSIVDTNADAPYLGRFRPSSATTLNNGLNLNKGQIDGNWTLEVEELEAGGTGTKQIVFFSLSFTSGLTQSTDVAVSTTPVRGALAAPYSTQVAPTATFGAGPGAEIASDNTLGAFSAHQGNLYVTYTTRDTRDGSNPASNTDIELVVSRDGGESWELVNTKVNDDDTLLDGFSGATFNAMGFASGGRPQFAPTVAVDPLTGALGLSWFDARHDASASRVARYFAYSLDGGNSFIDQTFLNEDYVITDGITGNQIVQGPKPDNQSVGNPFRDTRFSFGEFSSLTMLGGSVFASWSGNTNGEERLLTAGPGVQDRARLDALFAFATIPTGPKVIDVTKGLVGDTTNPDTSAGPTFSRFLVTFDRAVNPNSLNAGDFIVTYRAPGLSDSDTSGPGVSTVVVQSVTGVIGTEVSYAEGDAVNGFVGFTQFEVLLATPQTAAGTYTIDLANTYGDRIRQDGVTASNAGLVFDSVRPNDTVDRGFPIVVPGPRVSSVVAVSNGTQSPDGSLLRNGAVTALDIVFDRDMNPATFTTADVLKLVGPLGPISGSFTITPNPLGTDPTPGSPRTFRLTIPTQVISGSYSAVLSPEIEDANGNKLDADGNAGLFALFNQIRPGGTTTQVTVQSTGAATPIGATAGAVTRTLNVTENFAIQDLDLQLSITHPDVPILSAELEGPDGTIVRLFSNVGQVGTKANFNTTIFDDEATTLIQNGQAPFFGRFRTEEFNPLGSSGQRLSNFDGKMSAGTWILRVTTTGGATGSFGAFSLTLAKAVDNTGQGTPQDDQATLAFRIFTSDPTRAQSANTWLGVGPSTAAGHVGRVSSIAVDPSDPTGNTVYAGGATGGVWKTTNFLTTSPGGPVWVPLLDFGPSLSVNVGSIAIFPRNSDPNQSIIFVATGEGAASIPNGVDSTASAPGIGFLRSLDGGQTWQLLDSTTNFDANLQQLPINSTQRDKQFVGLTSYKIIVDPKVTPSGEVIVYAAMSDTTNANRGGIYRSLNSGRTWTRVLAGQATDVVLDRNSGLPDAISNPTGNLDIVYAAIRSQGIFISPNRGTVWNNLPGGIGRQLLRDAETATSLSPAVIPVGNAAFTPERAGGRVSLATPELTGNANNDRQYQGWLYALAANANGTLDGLYITKDFGQNWTRITLSSTPAGATLPNTPSNTGGDANLFTYTTNRGERSQALVVDPNDPMVVYVGGTIGAAVIPPNLLSNSQILRVDTTFVADPYAMFISSDRADGGQLVTSTNIGNVVVQKADNVAETTMVSPNQVLVGSPTSAPGINYLRNPADPFNTNATLFYSRVSSVVNSGIGATFSYVADFMSGTEIQSLVVIKDPYTQGTRLFAGNAQTIGTGVISTDGVFTDQLGGFDLVDGLRGGNMSLAQVNYGAVQPSTLAAAVAGALFYANTQTTGDSNSTSDVLTSGNLNRVGPTLDFGENYSSAGGVGVYSNFDPSGAKRGLVYKYRIPAEIGRNTDFFQIFNPGAATYTGRTFGLLQAGENPIDSVGQWEAFGLVNFATNPINGDQVIISSSEGRIYSTSNGGQFWLQIGTPAALDGTQALALAFGAPALNSPTGALNDFLYAGTVSGNMFVTFTGGGSNGNEWLDISAGLDGSPIRSIVTNPDRGSREVYVVTDEGVYYRPDSAAGSWINITGSGAGNLFSLTYAPFGNEQLRQPILNRTPGQTLRGLSSLAVDYRYSIPEDPTDPTSPRHPVLYVGGYGGVFRSLDNGTTWSLFPNVDIDNAPTNGGYLPNVQVTDLDLALGEIDTTTGRPLGRVDIDNNGIFDPAVDAISHDLLLASTFGRGQFAIRLAPIVLPGTLAVTGDTTVNQLGDGSFITRDATPTISGVSQQTGFGSNVRITLLDLTDPNNPVIIGGFDPNDAATDIAANYTDEFGNFTVNVNVGAYATDGIKTIGVQARSEAGTIGNVLTVVVAVDTTSVAPAAPDMATASDSGVSNTDNLTNVRRPTFTGTGVEPFATIELFANGTSIGTTQSLGDGTYSFTPSADLAEGAIAITARQTDGIGNVSPASAALNIVIDVTAPAALSAAPTVATASDTGASQTDGVTSDTTPTITGVALANARVEVLVGGNLAGTVVADGTGAFSFTLAALTDGNYVVTARVVDDAGNTGTASAPLNITIDTVVAAPSVPALLPTSDTGVANDNLTGVLRPTFTGTGAEAGATIQLLVDGVLAGSVVVPGGGAFSVAPTADIASGNRVITFRQVDLAGNISAASSGLNITVDPNAPVVTGVSTVGAQEDISFTGIIGNVTATNPLFRITVSWGDSTTNDVLLVGDTGPSNIVLVPDGNGGFNIQGTHTYTVPGPYTITITAEVNSGGVSSATTNALVINLPIGGPNGGVVTGGFAVAAVEGQAVAAQTVATFTDPGGTGTPSDYTISIDWGDGTTSAGVVTFDANTSLYTVTGIKPSAYLNSGTFSVTVTVTEGGASSSATSTATVTNAALTAGAAGAISSSEGSAFSGNLITFDNANVLEPIGELQATITWGDGTQSAGTITADPNTPGRFIVSGSNSYGDNGTFNGSVTITDNDGGTTTGSFTATITNVAPTIPAVASIQNFVGDTLTLNLSPTDISAADLAAGFRFEINWGDNTPPTIVERLAGNAVQSLTHVYTTTGTFTISITVTDKDGGVATQSATANILPPPSVQPPVIDGQPSQPGVVPITSDINTIGFVINAPQGSIPVVTSSNLTLLLNGSRQVSLDGVPFTYDQATGTGSLNLSNTTLADGDYQLQVRLSDDTILPVNFSKLTGDADGSGRVDSRDQRAIRELLGQLATSSPAAKQADVNGDGTVTEADLAVARSNNGRRLVSRTVTLNLNSRRGPTINFGNIPANSEPQAVDVVLRNRFREARLLGELRILGESLANVQVVGGTWNQLPTGLSIPAGGEVRVRIYLSPSSAARPIAGNLSVVHSNAGGLDSRRVESTLRGRILA